MKSSRIVNDLQMMKEIVLIANVNNIPAFYKTK